MRTIYIGGGQGNKSNNGSMARIYIYLFLFLIVIGSVLKISAPMIVEDWINRNGAGTTGYAYSIRDVDLHFGKGQLILMDVKIFNPETSAKLIEAPNLSIQLSWHDLLMSQKKKISIVAEKMDLILSKDLSSEMKRIQKATGKDLYLDSVEAKFGKLNIIEQKEDLSRTVIELNDVDVKVKEISLLSINKKTEFSISSSVADSGKLILTGKTIEENGSMPWSIQGSLKQVPPDIFNKIAGDKLPFSFRVSSLNAEIMASSENGEVTGEITPDIKILDLIEEKPGIPTQTIARALTDELTFILPFTLKNELTLQYADTFRKLKTYRKFPVAEQNAALVEAKISQTKKTKKGFSFWSF